MRSRLHTAALALALLTSLTAAHLAAPAQTGRAELASASVPERYAQLRATVARLADAAARREAARPWFPVLGEFNWGQEGAQFGAYRSGRAHEGQDVFARTGTPLVAVTGGVVLEAGDDGGRGNYVAIFDPRARRTFVYLHMNGPALVKRGERVMGGERVGAVGCTGSCDGDHLHLELRAGRSLLGAARDPEPALARWARDRGARATLPAGAH